MTARLASAALLLGIAGSAAHAQPKPQPDSPALEEARRLYVEGNEHYSAGRYTLAAERFIKAYELSGKPALLFNLANTYERAGNHEKAAHYLRLYLDGGEVHDAPAVRARIQRLEQTILENKRNAENAAPAPAPAAATPPPVVEEAVATRAPTPRPSRVPYYLAGAGLATGATVAIVFGLQARSERSEIDAMCSEHDGGVLCPVAAQEHLDAERRAALFSDIGVGVAAASVATSLIYYLVTRDRPSEPDDRTLSIVPSANRDGVGVLATGRF